MLPYLFIANTRYSSSHRYSLSFTAVFLSQPPLSVLSFPVSRLFVPIKLSLTCFISLLIGNYLLSPFPRLQHLARPRRFSHPTFNLLHSSSTSHLTKVSIRCRTPPPPSPRTYPVTARIPRSSNPSSKPNFVSSIYPTTTTTASPKHCWTNHSITADLHQPPETSSSSSTAASTKHNTKSKTLNLSRCTDRHGPNKHSTIPKLVCHTSPYIFNALSTSSVAMAHKYPT